VAVKAASIGDVVDPDAEEKGSSNSTVPTEITVTKPDTT
jgi:hypothetical protein